MSNSYGRYPIDDILTCCSNKYLEQDEYVELRSALKRFKKCELLDDVADVCDISELLEDHRSKMDKDQLIEYIVKLIKQQDKDVEDQIVAIKLKYCQIHVKSRQWNAFQIKNTQNVIGKNLTPDVFTQKLKNYLDKSNFSCKVTVLVDENMIWTAISIQRLKSKKDIVFLIMQIDLPLILHSNFKVLHRDIIQRALVQVFKGTSVEKVPLKTKNIDTLLYFGCKTLAADVDTNKLPKDTRKTTKKQKSKELKLAPNILNRNLKEEEEKQKYITKNFGVYEQPAIEAQTYNITSDFFGFSDEDEENIIPITCQAVFKGDNVFEGFRQMVENEIGNYPLPSHIMTVPESGCNKIKVNIKKPRTGN